MTEQLPDEPAEPDEFRRDRREHGGAPDRLDDDRLARLAEEERVDAGVDAYDPEHVPAATDEPPQQDLTQSGAYQEAEGEIRHELDEDELRRRGDSRPFPPTRYDRS